MKKTIKKKWLKALRSGRYKQCRQELCNSKGYCCLGVLARISGSKKQHLKFDNCKKDYRIHKFGGLLSPKFLREVGMKDLTQKRLSDMNDYDRKSFEEIADYIEKKL